MHYFFKTILLNLNVDSFFKVAHIISVRSIHFINLMDMVKCILMIIRNMLDILFPVFHITANKKKKI
jgi:hypothetical protein